MRTRTIWNPNEEAILRDNYSKLTIKELLNIFTNKTKSAIYAKANKLKLKKSPEHLDYWTEAETALLKENFPSVPRKKLIELLPHKTMGAINSKADRLELKRKIGKMEKIWPKDLVAWICGLISADGMISPAKKTRIVIAYSADLDWLDHIEHILTINGIGTSKYLKQHHNRFSDDPYAALYLNKRRPKQHHVGYNQFQELYESIKKHKLEKYMIPRKLETLRNYLEKDHMTIKMEFGESV